MLDKLAQLEQIALAELQDIQDEDELQRWKVANLGRSSSLMKTFDQLGSLPKDERPLIGRRANEVKRALEGAFDLQAEALRQAAVERSLAAERLDVTLPGRPVARGRLHPATQTLREIYKVFAEMGFQVYSSREVETDEFNFQLLNFPPHHPAREMQDTFFIDSGVQRGDNPVVMRTHTSPGQIRAMREFAAQNPDNPPPVRIILPGMCFRYEQITARSEIQFNQVEGLAVGEQITFGDLKGTLSDFARRMFGQGVRSRFRASHFPFTEPSAEMDIECFVCAGDGCPVCKRTGWLEILGCGMVHPVVLENGGYDPTRYSGFAFGMGPERITMLRHRIEDIRAFWANDLRFLEQF
ncbi:MAG TPA: phenylalanine--tRNA ligase subunit alpha [Anaerolineales bacterium]|nr:phenylalanine--tRNA ligase subunit alpha [Anaerolineales bacterium]